jgi:hypothetical protein
MNLFLIIVASFIVGSLYYYMMESSIPKVSNCSFISSIWTDILAFITGCIIVYKGFHYNDSMLTFLGSIIIVEHIWQLLPKYTMNKISYKLIT